uniref:Uncharacterized protein n=1 Tax=Aegilops tauschii subsp. strangulata TaxID=200361 RepID=A0A453IEU9_AEGTS
QLERLFLSKSQKKKNGLGFHQSPRSPASLFAPADPHRKQKKNKKKFPNPKPCVHSPPPTLGFSDDRLASRDPPARRSGHSR